MIGFQILPFLKIFVTDFSGTMKARKLKVCINMHNGWMYHIYWNRGQGSRTLRVMSLDRFSKKLKCILLNNCYVCGPTSMKLITHLEALKSGTRTNSRLMYREFSDQGQGPITHGLKSLDRFYGALVPCPTAVLSGKDELKIVQH